MESNSQNEIYNYLNKIPGFNKISTNQDFLDFLEEQKNNIIIQASKDLWDILTIDPSLTELTDNQKKKLKEYEIFLIVDENDEIILDSKGFPLVDFRKNCHNGKEKQKFIHRVSDFIVINEKNQILLGERSNGQDSYDGFISILGGHCGILDYEKTLEGEFKEELGLELKDQSYKKLFKYRFEDKNQSQFTSLFEVKIDSSTDLDIDYSELNFVKWYSIDDLIKLIVSDSIKIVHHEKYIILKYIKDNNLYLSNKDSIDRMLKKTLLEMEKEKVYIK